MGVTRHSGVGATQQSGLQQPSTDVHWLELQIQTLYHHDERGRLLRSRQFEQHSAPAFHLSRSAHGNLWRFASGLEPALVRELSRLAAREAPLRAGTLRDALDSGAAPAPPERWPVMRRLLDEAGVVSDPDWWGPAFRFPGPASGSVSTAPTPSGMTIRLLTIDDVERLRDTPFEWLVDERPHSEPVVGSIDGGSVVGAAWSARGAGAVAAPAREAGVEVLPSHRGRGVGVALVESWAAQVRARSALPLYSTSWSNRASRALADRLGLIPYGENGHLG